MTDSFYTFVDSLLLAGMYLSRITLNNFKNYFETELRLSPRINCFVGDNGVGKTNILDAIHYLSLTKSYFTNIDFNNIRHGEDYFLVKGEFFDDKEKFEVYCGFQRDRRKMLKLNNKVYDKLSDHIGKFPVVMISPADGDIIAEGSEVRRRFMNNVISQYNRQYLEQVITYNKALKTRNRLLKDSGRSGKFDREMLSLWERHMIPAATLIHSEREWFVRELIPVFQEYYDHISGKREKVELKYRSQLEERNMEVLLEESYEKDKIMQYTTSGVHRDDLLLMMDDHPIKELGSQGQQKSYLVALKLAKFEYITKRGGKKPVLLMDDVFDKFDEKRVEQIIELVSDNRFGQIFITDTNEERLGSILDRANIDFKLFRINGGVREVKSNGESGKIE